MGRPSKEIGSVGVVGAGTMGSGIAQVAAAAGYEVLLSDQSSQALEAALGKIRHSLERVSRKEDRPSGWIGEVLGRIRPVTDLEGLTRADLVIEAVFEDRGAKTLLLERLGGLLPAETLLASNTSTIPITALAASSGRPGRFAGLHFFNPVPVMPLVELIPGLLSEEETLDLLEEFARRLGKETVRCKDRPGFIANRLLLPLLSGAIRLLDEGTAEAEAIDRAMTLGAAHPMGPLRLADLVGLDVVLHALESMHAELGEAALKPPPLLRRLVEAGRLGCKTGMGFYAY